MELNLSSNNFSSDSVLVDPNHMMLSLSTISHLQKLNLSRNKLKGFHSELLPENNVERQPHERVFNYLEELNFSFNVIEQEGHLMYAAKQLPNLKVLIVTGNPFAITGENTNYQVLKGLLEQRGSSLINETLQGPTYLRRSGNGPRGIPPLPVA